MLRFVNNLNIIKKDFITKKEDNEDTPVQANANEGVVQVADINGVVKK